LNNYKPIETKNLYQDLNKAEYTDLSYKLYEDIITVVKNNKNTLPFNSTKQQNIAYVKLGDDVNDTFIEALQANQPITVFNLYNLEILQNMTYEYVIVDENDAVIETLQSNKTITVFNHYQNEDHMEDLKAFELVIAGYHKADGVWKKHDMTANEVTLLDNIAT